MSQICLRTMTPGCAAGLPTVRGSVCQRCVADDAVFAGLKDAPPKPEAPPRPAWRDCPHRGKSIGKTQCKTCSGERPVDAYPCAAKNVTVTHQDCKKCPIPMQARAAAPAPSGKKESIEERLKRLEHMGAKARHAQAPADLSGEGCGEFSKCVHLGEEKGNAEHRGKTVPLRWCRRLGQAVKACECNGRCKGHTRHVRVSVAICAKNEGRELVETVWSFWDGSGQGVDEVRLLDDASTDDTFIPFVGPSKWPHRTPEGIRRPDMPPIYVTRMEESVGCNLGRNLLLNQTECEIIVYLDGHQRVSGQLLRQLADVAYRENAIVQPASVGLEFDSPFHAYGCDWRATIDREYNKDKGTWELPEMPFKLGWTKLGKPKEAFERRDGLMGGCYVIPTMLLDTLDGWLSCGGRWGYSEEILSHKAALCDVPILTARDYQAAHLYRDRKARPYDAPPEYDVWLSRFAGLRVVLEPKTFERMLPDLKERYWVATDRECPVKALLDSEKVAAEHASFQKVRAHDDRWFFMTHLGQEAADRWAPQ